MTPRKFDSVLVRTALMLYRIANYLLLVPLLIYLWWRGRKDKLYSQHLAERFGFYQHAPVLKNPVWVHAVSLGELRSAVPLIKALLARGDHIVTSHFT
ncbi:MAG: glycosyltransferase N-terminal domain-containing protein, partial [Pseudomonadota bacterium]